MIDWGRSVRSMVIGIVMAVVVIGLLPFLFADFASDLSGVGDLDSSPLLASVSKFIRWGK